MRIKDKPDQKYRDNISQQLQHKSHLISVGTMFSRESEEEIPVTLQTHPKKKYKGESKTNEPTIVLSCGTTPIL